MIQRLMVRLLAGKDSEIQGISADVMLNGMDKKLENFSTLVKPLPESKPRTPFDGPNGENLSPARGIPLHQMLKMIPDAISLILGMWGSSRMYDGQFVATQSEASPQFIAGLEAMAYAAGAKDIKYIKVPRNAIFQDKGIPHEYAIVFTVEMQKEPMDTAPSFECMHEVAKGYKNLAQIGNKLAEHMHKHGFAAYPGTALGGVTDYVHLAEIAGLGITGYHGLLITPGEGARIRINTIYTNITNLPIANEQENEHLWVRDFCAMCRKCVRKCPVDAIYDQPETRGDGGMQCIDHDTCRDYFAENFGCAVCLSVCPFSQVGYEKVKERFKGNPNAPQFTIPVKNIQ
ncbi:MAG: 4Fe-4S binding protein, partial [Chloroflexota bacterium]